jgi:hypothetical protein
MPGMIPEWIPLIPCHSGIDTGTFHNPWNFAKPVRERAALVPLICRSKADLTVEKKHARRLECIKLWIKWQDRQESQRRGKLASASKHRLVPEPLKIKTVPEKCKPI